MKYDILLKNVDIDLVKNNKHAMNQIAHVFKDLAKGKSDEKQLTCNKLVNNCEEIINLLNKIISSRI